MVRRQRAFGWWGTDMHSGIPVHWRQGSPKSSFVGPVRLARMARPFRNCLRPGWPLLGVLFLSVCGCTTLSDYIHNGFKVGPNYKRPPAPLADHWIDANDVRVRSEEWDDSHWWTVF